MPQPAARWSATLILSVATVLAGTPQADADPPASAPMPALDYALPVTCGSITEPNTGTAHAVRYQCDAKTRTCHVARNDELDAEGRDTQTELSRTQVCGTDDVLEKNISEGFVIIPSHPETPPGWVRDERERVMQFNFDMHRRVWLGGGLEMGLPRPGGSASPQGEAQFGIRGDWTSDDTEATDRLHILEGRLDPGLGETDFEVLQWDFSRVYHTPSLRLTSFIGHPRRFDVVLDFGLWLQAGRIEAFTVNGNTQTLATLAAFDPTLDLWRSRDLESYLRLRAGAGAGYDGLHRAYLFVPNAGLDLEDILDADGFHRLYANFTYQRDVAGAVVPAGRPSIPTVAGGAAGYEVILLAIDDQPISLDLEARGGYRDDLSVRPAGWEWAGAASLRFSFWAPARRTAPSRLPQKAN